MVEKILVIFPPTVFNESQQLAGFGTYSEGAVSETQTLWHREQHRMQRSLKVSGRRRDKANSRLGAMYQRWEGVREGARELGSWR